jgi:dynein heavy chain
VEEWLNGLLRTMKATLRYVTEIALETAANWEVGDVPRHVWLENYPAQVVLLASQIFWTEEVEGSLDEFENGQLDAVRTNLELCNTRLSALIELVCGELGPSERVKVNTMITIDVHARDVVQKLVDIECDSTENFAWHSQMRFVWSEETKDVQARIADFVTLHSFEYVGNVGRLVITPLTDKCCITLSMALRLNLGAAPAGPAGTGKTETTKDLARALGISCYVFNCSDQMNYQTMANNFKGLAQTGAWGCFDEFNRINVEVLSVVAAQVLAILEAVGFLSQVANRAGKYAKVAAGRPPETVGQFSFFGESISLIPTCGFFITMNPG